MVSHSTHTGTGGTEDGIKRTQVGRTRESEFCSKHRRTGSAKPGEDTRGQRLEFESAVARIIIWTTALALAGIQSLQQLNYAYIFKLTLAFNYDLPLSKTS